MQFFLHSIRLHAIDLIKYNWPKLTTQIKSKQLLLPDSIQLSDEEWLLPFTDVRTNNHLGFLKDWLTLIPTLTEIIWTFDGEEKLFNVLESVSVRCYRNPGSEKQRSEVKQMAFRKSIGSSLEFRSSRVG